MRKIKSFVPGLASLILLGCGYAQNSSKRDLLTQEYLMWGALRESANIAYKKEENVMDYWQTPQETLRLRTGDCEDKTNLLKHELDRIPIKNRFAAGELSLAIEEGELLLIGHVWNEVLFDRRIFIADPTRSQFMPKDEAKNGEHNEMSNYDPQIMRKLSDYYRREWEESRRLGEFPRNH